MFQVHRHKTEPRRFFIYEQYKDDAALEAHRATPHFLQYARKDLPKVATEWKAICLSRWDSPCGAGSPPASFQENSFSENGASAPPIFSQG